jgi:transposase
MARKGLEMKIVEDIERLKGLGFSQRKIAKCLGLHRVTVKKYFAEKLIEIAIGPKGSSLNKGEEWAQSVDWEKVREEKLAGVPISVVYEELRARGVVPVQLPAFWKQLVRRAPILKSTMVRVFAPGSRIEIDYADGINLVNLVTGELVKTQLFVGVLAASRYTFAEFSLSQSSEDFLTSHVKMLNFFGGVAEAITPDNLKSAVTKAHRYDPILNPAYTRLASFYGFAVLPARVKKPQDKAIVERTIQIFQRWFFFLVRNRTFTSLTELNNVLKEHLVIFHSQRHRIFKKTRQEMFETEREHLKKLPLVPYQVHTHKQAMLSRDCHLEFEGNFYSGPHSLRGQRLDVWSSAKVVEVYSDGERVGLHNRARLGLGKYVTDKSHYPPAHQAYEEEDLVKLRRWAEGIGPETKYLIELLLSGTQPLRYLRRAQGILNLSRHYPRPALENAVKVANQFEQTTYAYVKRLLLRGMRKNISNQESIKRSENPHLRGVDEILH